MIYVRLNVNINLQRVINYDLYVSLQPFVKFYLDQVKETSLEEKEREALEGESISLRLVFKDVSFYTNHLA